MTDPRYVGLRARFNGEDCPLCDDPGSGMWQDKEEGRWICTRCKHARRPKYWLSTGTVQPIGRSDSPFWCYHFGHAQYDRTKPILTDSIRRQAQPIIDALNAGTVTREQAEKDLDEIWL